MLLGLIWVWVIIWVCWLLALVVQAGGSLGRLGAVWCLVGMFRSRWGPMMLDKEGKVSRGLHL